MDPDPLGYKELVFASSGQVAEEVAVTSCLLDILLRSGLLQRILKPLSSG